MPAGPPKKVLVDGVAGQLPHRPSFAQFDGFALKDSP